MQNAQLVEANQAWQTHHQSQVDNFRSKIQECVEVADDASLDQMAQQIADQTNREREEFVERYDFLEQTTNDLRTGMKFNVFSYLMDPLLRINGREEEFSSPQRTIR